MDATRRRQRLSLDLLKGFEAAARHLSFTRAGDELALTQSAVSREIKSLEEQLGQALFVRVHRGLQLTEPGRQLHEAVSTAFALIDEATDRLASGERGETLTITTSAPLASTWLVPKLTSFFRLRPDVDVRCVSADHRLDLERERIDLALRWLPEGSTIDGGERLFDLKRFPVCAPALAEDPQRPLRRPADLAHHVLLDLQTKTSQGLWSDWEPWLAAMDMSRLRPAGALKFSHYDQVLHAAIEGSGVAVGRYPHNARHLHDGVLVAPLGKDAILEWGSYYILAHPRSGNRPVVRQFVEWLHGESRRDMAAIPQLARPARKRRR